MSPASSTPLPALGSGGSECPAGRERTDTHRPRLPVWASCRMRCSCLIILGVGWGLRGHGGGRGPGSPRPSLPLPAALLSPRMGGRRSPLPGPAALSLAARSLLLRSRLRPRAPGHSSLQVCFLALPHLPGPPQNPLRPPAGPRVCRAAGRLAVHRLRPQLLLPAPPRPARVAGSR